jgi:glycerol kinase
MSSLPHVTTLALDLGSTRIKAARLQEDGSLSQPTGEAAPALHGSGTVREGDAEAYREVAERVLARARSEDEESPLALACQRSSFVLWERATGRLVTPLVSWQDRRAAEWCARHPEIAERMPARTGLRLSPHYVGPKLAAMAETDSDLRDGLRGGALCLGTLDTWLIRTWSDGVVHRIDPTMAARTLLFDPAAGDWADDLLEAFGVPRAVLPSVVASVGDPIALPGRGPLRVTLADQAAGLLGAAGMRDDVVLVNFGTGCFVLRATGTRFAPTDGYLAGPIGARKGESMRFAIEGTINGGAGELDAAGAPPTELPESDPAPDAFCLPDGQGIGAPHWRARIPLTLSDAASASEEGRRRVVLEGLLFRVREILDDIGRPEDTARLAGGVTRDPAVASGLAACLERPVEVIEEPETTMLGAARLAAGIDATAGPRARLVAPGAAGSYLAAKFERWKEWAARVLTSPGAP